MVSSHPDPCLVLVSSCSISTTSGSGNSLIVHWPIANTPECCQRAFSTQWFAFAYTCGFKPRGQGMQEGVAEWGKAGYWGGKAVRVGIRLSFCLSRLNKIDLLWVPPSHFVVFFSKCIIGQLSLTSRICIFVICMNSLEPGGNLRLCVHVCMHGCICVSVHVPCNLTNKIRNLSKQSNR